MSCFYVYHKHYKNSSNVEKSTMFTSSSLSSSSTSSSSSASSSSSCHSLHDELEMMPTSCLSSASCGSSSSSHHATATTDYINANFVQGYSHEHKFIATQGPKRETLVDFWHMCWQYRVSAVVMLTKLVEKGVERCTQYWPERLNMAERYGDYEVTWRDQQRCGDYLKRSFDLVHLPTAAAAASANTLGKHLVASTPGSMSMTGKQQQQQRLLKVTQYYYPEWPDKETPSTDPISILHLIRDVNAAHLAYHYPIVVHCSAGVGRTGTYITLDAMLEKIERESRIDIYGFISRIRARRQYLVQTAKQYAFVHEALYEYCLYGFTDIECQRFASHLKRLREPVTSAGAAAVGSRSRLYDEYDKLASAFAPNQSARQAFAGENKAKNRCLDAICFDENRVKLSTLSGSAYINATRLKGLGLAHGSELIITQDPLVHTQLDFWKMVVEYECNLIVALNSEYEKVNIWASYPFVCNCHVQLRYSKYVICVGEDGVLADCRRAGACLPSGRAQVRGRVGAAAHGDQRRRRRADPVVGVVRATRVRRHRAQVLELVDAKDARRAVRVWRRVAREPCAGRSGLVSRLCVPRAACRGLSRTLPSGRSCTVSICIESCLLTCIQSF